MGKSLKNFIESLGNNVRTISKSDCIKFFATDKGLTLSGICNESAISAKITSDNETIYKVKKDKLSPIALKENVYNIFQMYSDSVSLLESDENSDLERTDDEKQLLKDEVEVEEEVVDETSEDSKTTMRIKEDDIESVKESPATTIKDLEVSIEDVINLKGEINALADKADDMLKRFGLNDNVNRALVIGLVGELYSVANDFDDFIESCTDQMEEMAGDMSESICVPAKTDFMDLTSAGINQAYNALKRSDKHKDILDVLEDIKSELAVRK